MTDISLESRYLNCKRSLFDTYYSFLNEQQRKAVFTINGPLLILAGAGSGKTTVLVNRLAYIVRYGNAYHSTFVPEGITEGFILEMEKKKDLQRNELGEYLTIFRENVPKPWHVMAITFTNKAAGEIKDRVRAIFGESSTEPDQIWSGTFHSVCLRILRKYNNEIPYEPNFSICDTDDQKKQINQCFKDLNMDENKLSIKDILYEMGRAKDELLSPEEMANKYSGDYKLRQIAKIYYQYQKRLRTANVMDFDDIIMQTVLLLKNNERVRTELQTQFRYISIDEYQDTNKSQFMLAFLLSGLHKNLMVVGDDDQSIYKFRGATIENILGFDRHFNQANIIKLEQNYRSTGMILSAANAVIKNNKHRRGKELWTQHSEGEPIKVVYVENQLEEADYVASKIENQNRSGVPYRDFAILYRMNSQSRTLENALTKRNIPYRIIGGTRFYDRAEIKDLIAYLHVAANPRDDVHFMRIMNTPKRGIGLTTQNALSAMTMLDGQSMQQIARKANFYPAFNSASAKKLIQLSGLFDHFHAEVPNMPLSELLHMIITEIGYEDYLRTQEDAEDRIQNMQELVSNTILYETTHEDPTLVGFLEEISLLSDVDKYDTSADAVVLMTIHSSKGLEFPHVFLPGMEENIFPSYMVTSSEDEAELEEERRLAYVAITRAKNSIDMIHTHDRMVYNSFQSNPLSRFVREIPKEIMKEENLTYHTHYQTFDDDFDYDNAMPRRDLFSSFGMPVERHSIGGETFGMFQQKKPSLDYVVVKDSPKVEDVIVGDRVRHATFGYGFVTRITPLAKGEAMIEVAFDTCGTKKLMKTFGKIKKI